MKNKCPELSPKTSGNCSCVQEMSGKLQYSGSHFPENVQKMSRRVQAKCPESVRNIAIFQTFPDTWTISGHSFFIGIVYSYYYLFNNASGKLFI